MATWVLGVSALFHDAAVCLLRDGEIVAAAQEERFSRIKSDPSLPLRAARWCMEEAGIRASDLDWLVFYEKPLRKFERVLATSVATFPRGWRSFPRAMQAWLGDKLWLRSNLVRTFGVRPERILFSEHHLSHAASAFLCSPFDSAAILTVDGVGESASTGLWRGEGGQIEPISELRFPHSLGMLYSALTAYLGFAVNDGEYKVMGMAAYGQPSFRAEIDKLLLRGDDGGFEIALDYFCYHWHPTESYTDALVGLLGPARFPGSPFTPAAIAGDAPREQVESSQHYADIAASLQAATEDALLALAERARAETGAPDLCMAGGVALNSVANHRLAAEGPFERIWIQPAAGDAGGAMGAALWAWHSVLGNPRAIGEGLTRVDLGRGWSRDEVREMLDDLGLPYEDLGGLDQMAERAAEELAAGGVIGWFQGRFEWGPRALGFRSILADPRTREMQDRVNARIKFRETFRPFAPAVTAEAAGDWFELDDAAEAPARFMLAVPQVRPERREQLGAVTHVNGSARVQVVRAQDNPAYHQLIRRFGERTGVPVILNTSFNLKGEPIVSSPVDAAATLMRSGLDALYIEGFRVERRDFRATR